MTGYPEFTKCSASIDDSSNLVAKKTFKFTIIPRD